MNLRETLEHETGTTSPDSSVEYIFRRGALTVVMVLINAHDDLERADSLRALALELEIDDHDGKVPRPDPELAHLTLAHWWQKELSYTSTAGVSARRIEFFRKLYYTGARYAVIKVRGEDPPEEAFFDRSAYEAMKLEVARANGYAEAPKDRSPGSTSAEIPPKLQ